MKLLTSPKQQAVLNKLFSLSPEVCYQSAWSMRFLGIKKKKRSANVFLWHQTKTCLLENLAALQEHIMFSVRWVEVCELSEIFSEKLYYKMGDLFW